MNKLMAVTIATLLLLVVELFTFLIVSIGSKSFDYRHWTSGSGDTFTFVSLLFIFGYAVATACILTDEIKLKK